MWNLRTFKLYNNDLWGTLLLSHTLTHPLKYLLKVRYKTRFHYKSAYEGKLKQRLKKVIRFKFFNRMFNTSKKGYFSVKPYSIGLDKVSSDLRVEKYAHLNSLNRKNKFKKFKIYNFKTSYKLWRRVAVLFRNRYQFSRGYRKSNFKPLKNKFLIDYTKPKSYDKLKARLKRRTFNSQRIINFRKFKKFYSTLTSRQFYRLVSYTHSLHSRGSLVINFINKIESRFDVMLFRSGLVTSLFMAKHFIVHGHITINNELCVLPSKYINTLDLVAINNSSFSKIVQTVKVVYTRRWLAYVIAGAKKRYKRKVSVISFFLPSYLEVDYKAFSFILIADVFFKNVFYPFKISLPELEGFLNRIRVKV